MALKNRFTSKKLLASIVILLVLVVAGFYYHASRPNKGSGVIPTKDTAANVTAHTKQDTSTTTADSSTATPAESAKNSPGVTQGSTSLKAPDGTFVSNHRVSLSGSPQQKSEQSVCNTTPGATCYIKLTKDSITKTLKEQTTDSSGATYWSWNIDDAGLTVGTWQVSAIAILNGQTKTTPDGIDLVVQP